jgi:hypothetical protein
MNVLTQLTIGEVLDFLATLDDNTLVLPSWGRPIPSEEDSSRVCFARVDRGTVRTLRNTITRVLEQPLRGIRYTHDTLVDVRTVNSGYQSLTLGMLIASVSDWKKIGEAVPPQ